MMMPKIRKAEQDLIALGIAVAAILLFVATGSKVMPSVMRSLLGNGSSPDNLLVTAMLLNIALIIFGWRRYRELMDEVSERRKAEETARRLAETDPLTGCLNRRAMAQATEDLRARSNAHGKSIAFVMVDIDNFKQINDMNGHTAGDTVLTTLADRLREKLPNDALLARLGGDEFAFVMPFENMNMKRIDDLVMQLFESLGKGIMIDNMKIEATMSIGVATDRDSSQAGSKPADATALMHRADIAMYHAKKRGKNRFYWFEPNMENELRFRNELEVGIKRGVLAGEFVPYYEQQVDLSTGELTGFEMLARWHSPELGLVSPEVFIPIAEDIGLISDLSEQLIEQALNDAKEWADDLSLSVNISPVQMRDPWFPQRLLKMLVKHNFPNHRLEIEITESCLHENVGMVRSMLSSLRNQGVRVSLDDFGTGYSSLEQLRSLPFDRLKIDRSFVTELRKTDANSKIIDAIVSLGNGLDMPITVEGIEDQQILDALKTMGHLKGQGYLYGKPEDANTVRRRLQEAGKLAKERPALSSGRISGSDTDQSLEAPAPKVAKA
ncbi:EAL domain-containing protein [Altererythrobacter lutimaris]|uniref:EAL domain-containing protein n=1 Tax=Altererythrobacter lutimaris TaxID=2743979 RepID=A0A850HA84_9SPHN|nr:EAL domain-containing protein [Altererythrobacter lutimaris]NVE94390.1 EAL domain-containing protein [Altererythrobacter lutimaris]